MDEKEIMITTYNVTMTNKETSLNIFLTIIASRYVILLKLIYIYRFIVIF